MANPFKDLIIDLEVKLERERTNGRLSTVAYVRAMRRDDGKTVQWKSTRFQTVENHSYADELARIGIQAPAGNGHGLAAWEHFRRIEAERAAPYLPIEIQAAEARTTNGNRREQLEPAAHKVRNGAVLWATGEDGRLDPGIYAGGVKAARTLLDYRRSLIIQWQETAAERRSAPRFGLAVDGVQITITRETAKDGTAFDPLLELGVSIPGNAKDGELLYASLGALARVQEEQLGGPTVARRTVKPACWENGRLELPAPGSRSEVISGYGKVAPNASADGWRRVAEIIARHPAGALYLGEAIGGCFLEGLAALTETGLRDRLSPPGFVNHTPGDSGGGKSSLLRVGASVYGNPDEIVYTWGGTGPGLKDSTPTVGAVPIFLDELHAWRFSDAVLKTTVFGVLGERVLKSSRSSETRAHGGGFSSIINSTGNRYLTAVMGGIESKRRVVEIAGPLTADARAAEEAKQLARVNHGWVFAQILNGAIALEDVAGWYQPTVDELDQALQGAESEVHALARSRAAQLSIGVAGARVLDALTGPAVSLGDAALLAARRQMREIALLDVRGQIEILLDAIREESTRRPDRYPDPFDTDRPWREIDGWITEKTGDLVVLAGALREIAERYGIADVTPALTMARERGILKCRKGLTGQAKRNGRRFENVYVFAASRLWSNGPAGSPPAPGPSNGPGGAAAADTGRRERLFAYAHARHAGQTDAWYEEYVDQLGPHFDTGDFGSAVDLRAVEPGGPAEPPVEAVEAVKAPEPVEPVEPSSPAKAVNLAPARPRQATPQATLLAAGPDGVFSVTATHTLRVGDVPAAALDGNAGPLFELLEQRSVRQLLWHPDLPSGFQADPQGVFGWFIATDGTGGRREIYLPGRDEKFPELGAELTAGMSAADGARTLALFADALPLHDRPFNYWGTPSISGRTILFAGKRSLGPVGPHPDVVLAPGVAPAVSHLAQPSPADIDLGRFIQWDGHGAYLAASSSAITGRGTPNLIQGAKECETAWIQRGHTKSGRLRLTAGFWHVRISSPDPLAQCFFQSARRFPDWHHTHTVELAYELRTAGLAITVGPMVKAWVYPDQGTDLRQLYERFRDARRKLEAMPPDPSVKLALKLSKLCVNGALGKLGSRQEIERAQGQDRPDWYAAARARAGANIARHVLLKVKDARPFAIDTDSVFFATPTVDPAAGAPSGLDVSAGLGKFTAEGHGLISDVIALLEAGPRAYASTIPKLVTGYAR